MNSSVISKAKIEDIKKIVKIHKKCISRTNSDVYSDRVIKSWLRQISEENVLSQFKNTFWIVVSEGNNVIGFAQYDLQNQTLYQIQIDPDYQGKGYGKKIYEYIENVFIENNLKKIFLNSTLNAEPFYISLGFKSISNILFDDIELISMEKNLVL